MYLDIMPYLPKIHEWQDKYEFDLHPDWIRNISGLRVDASFILLLRARSELTTTDYPYFPVVYTDCRLPSVSEEDTKYAQIVYLCDLHKTMIEIDKTEIVQCANAWRTTQRQNRG